MRSFLLAGVAAIAMSWVTPAGAEMPGAASSRSPAFAALSAVSAVPLTIMESAAIKGRDATVRIPGQGIPLAILPKWYYMIILDAMIGCSTYGVCFLPDN